MNRRPFGNAIPTNPGAILRMSDDEYRASLAAMGWGERAIESEVAERQAYFERITPPKKVEPKIEDDTSDNPLIRAILRRRGKNHEPDTVTERPAGE